MIDDNDPILIRMKDVLKLVPLSRAEIDRKVKAGQFPPRVRLGQASTAFEKRKVVEWVQERIRQSSEPPVGDTDDNDSDSPE